jgi:hypothetical protein
VTLLQMASARLAHRAGRPREQIRQTYAEFVESGDAVPSLAWTPLR